MLIESGRLIAELGERGADQCADYAASAVSVVAAGFIEQNDEQAILLEDRVLDQDVDIVFEPVVGGAEAAIVGIIAAVGCDKGVVGKASGGEILVELFCTSVR